MSDKIRCGKGKKIKDGLLSVTINPDVINEHIEEYQGHKYVRLTIQIFDKPDDYGKDVKITINDWKPGGSQNYDNSASSSETRTGTFYDKPVEEGAGQSDDLPF